MCPRITPYVIFISHVHLILSSSSHMHISTSCMRKYQRPSRRSHHDLMTSLRSRTLGRHCAKGRSHRRKPRPPCLHRRKKGLASHQSASTAASSSPAPAAAPSAALVAPVVVVVARACVIAWSPLVVGSPWPVAASADAGRSTSRRWL